MSYSTQLGKISPLVLRDALLDYLLGRETAGNVSMWEYYGDPRQLFLPSDHPQLLTRIYGGTVQAERFFYQLSLAMETLHRSCSEFYPEGGRARFLELRREMLAEDRCMLYFKLIAWLSLGGREEVEALIPQARGLNLTYGLVVHCPEPILHTARCFACYDQSEYERALPSYRLEEIRQRAASLAAEQAMSPDEPTGAPRQENIESQELGDELELMRLRSQLVESIIGILRLSCPLRKQTRCLTDRLWSLLKDWMGN